MQIKCIKNYRGPYGTFTEGQTGDFLTSVVKRLPKEHFKVVDSDAYDGEYEEKKHELDRKKKAGSGESSRSGSSDSTTDRADENQAQSMAAKKPNG